MSGQQIVSANSPFPGTLSSSLGKASVASVMGVLPWQVRGEKGSLGSFVLSNASTGMESI